MLWTDPLKSFANQNSSSEEKEQQKRYLNSASDASHLKYKQQFKERFTLQKIYHKKGILFSRFQSKSKFFQSEKDNLQEKESEQEEFNKFYKEQLPYFEEKIQEQIEETKNAKRQNILRRQPFTIKDLRQILNDELLTTNRYLKINTLIRQKFQKKRRQRRRKQRYQQFLNLLTIHALQRCQVNQPSQTNSKFNQIEENKKKANEKKAQGKQSNIINSITSSLQSIWKKIKSPLSIQPVKIQKPTEQEQEYEPLLHEKKQK